jgi:TolA-binding protein
LAGPQGIVGALFLGFAEKNAMLCRRDGTECNADDARVAVTPMIMKGKPPVKGHQTMNRNNRAILALAAIWAIACPAGLCSTTDTARERRPPKFLELKLFPKATPTPAPRPTPAASPTSAPVAAPKPTPQPTPVDPVKAAEAERLRQEAEAQKLFDLAVGYIKRDRRAQAKTLLNRVAREYPKTDLAPRALVQIAEIEDDLSQADNILTRVIHDYPNTEWAEVAWYKRGEVNMLLWDYRAALEMFGQYLKRNPRSTRATAIQRQMAICRLHLGEAEKALADLEQLCKDKPEVATEPETLETLAECHVELGHTDQALAPLDALIRKHPAYANLARASMLYALCLEDQNRFTEAIGAYGRLIEQFPRSPAAGLARMRLADLREPLAGRSGESRGTTTTATAPSVRSTTATVRAVRPPAATAVRMPASTTATLDIPPVPPADRRETP